MTATFDPGHALQKNRYAAAPKNPDFTIDQRWDSYSADEHDRWDRLFARMAQLLPRYACASIRRAVDLLSLSEGGIPDMERLSDRLEPMTGWRVVPVADLVPDDVFFDHLANRRFPAGAFIRPEAEFDYLQEPDIFHDIFGHVPMLADPVFAEFMEAYGKGGNAALERGQLHHLARLYWYTVEFGLIREDGDLKVFGAGIISSPTETRFCLEDTSSNRVAFDLRRVMRTKYIIDDFQQTYFVIDRFEDLLSECYRDFAPLYREVAELPDIEAHDLLESDTVISIGTQSYFAKRSVAPQNQERRMADLFDNPAGLNGFEFIEFSAPEKGVLESVFETIGFEKVARHRSKDVDLWRQGGINFLANYEPDTPAWHFAREHGPSACAMGFRVRNAVDAFQHLVENGAEPASVQAGAMELSLPAIRGIGNSIIYLIDRYDASNDGTSLSIYDVDFEYIDGVDKFPVGCGFKLVDHLTHNVHRGRMAYWADFYERLFNFQEIRFFDIKGEYTGLTSKALTAPDGKIRIPLNEEGENGKGQIEEYLRAFNGEGIQHIALICDDLVACWDKLKAAGVPFMTAPPDTYYDMLEERLPDHGEDVGALRSRGILLDGTIAGGKPRLLLQLFAEPQLGPVFFEFIQRKGDEGFGEGNFKALFESIERDQVSRGVLDVEETA